MQANAPAFLWLKDIYIPVYSSSNSVCSGYEVVYEPSDIRCILRIRQRRYHGGSMNLEITDINQIPLVLARIENQGTLVPTKRFVEMAEDALAKMQAADIIQPDVLQIIERHTGFLIVGIAKTQVCVYFMTHEGLFLLDGIMIPV